MTRAEDPKIIVVMPAYNAAKTLEACYGALPKNLINEVVLVDDGSRDNTVEIAKKLPIKVFVHEKNRGYGGNQKTCYSEAMKLGADIMIMVHPDHQYDPSFIPEFIKGISEEGFDAVFGSRMMFRKDAKQGGMPLWKYWANIALTDIGNLILGTKLTEFHSGFRAYHRRVFEKIDISRNSDDFIFDTQIIIQLKKYGFRIKEIPISTRYFKEASQIKFWPSVKYGLGIIWNLTMYVFRLRNF